MAWTERYVSVAGGGAHDGTTEADAWTLAEAIAAPYAAGQRINVKAGTYANTTTTRTFGVTGTTTAPIWWRGYNTTIGDLDDSHALALPVITFTTGVFDVTGAYHIISNLDISGAQTTAAQVRLRTGISSWVDRCRIECTSANSAGLAIGIGTVDGRCTRSWLKSNAAADVVQMNANGSTLIGCAIVNGKDGARQESATNVVIAFNTFRDQASNAIQLTNVTGRTWILANSIYSPVGNGIDMTTAVPLGVGVINNILSECAGFGIDNSSGANTANVYRLHNLFHGNGADENAMGDSPSLSSQTDAGTPFTSSTNLTIVDGSNAIANGIPGQFENETHFSFLDIGAVQREEPTAGGGGLLRHPGMTGGING